MDVSASKICFDSEQWYDEVIAWIRGDHALMMSVCDEDVPTYNFVTTEFLKEIESIMIESIFKPNIEVGDVKWTFD